MRTWIAFLLCVSVEIAAVPQKEVIVTMQTKRWTHILSDNFLSLTVTPEIALRLEDFSKTTMSMLKGLSPTMLRLGGPSTDKMKFMPEKISSDNFTITEAQWTRLNQFIEDVNMNLVVCLNSKDRVHGVWESRDSVELIYSSEKNGYKLGWELGYESQNLQQDGVTGSQLGRDVARLKNILGDFSKYSDSPIIGPDMKSLSTPEEVRFLREYLEESADSLTAITWHPQFSSMNAEDEDVSHKFLGIIHDMENKIWNKSNGLRSPIQPPPKKPIWLAESNSDEYTGNFSDSLTWIKRMGAAARLGFPVIMKKLTAASLITPTPDYWVSLLYKTLVGRAVMDVKYLVGNNRSTLQVFSHCAHVNEEGSDSVLAPGLRYTQGSVVLYGLNLNDEETRLTVRGNVKEETVHKYVLTAAEDDHEMEASDEEETEIRKRPSPAKTLLNGQLLSLLSNSELPTISPVETRPSRTLSFNIPGRSVFFFVMPDMRLKTCTSFTNIQGNEKVNTLERGQSLMKSSFMAATRPEDGPKFNFSPGGKINLESRLPVDANSNELWKPPSFGVGLKGRFSDGRLNRGLVGLPRPRIPLDSNRLKTIEKGTVLQDQLSTTIQTPVEETEQINEFENKTIGDEMQPIDDQEPLKTKTKFVMFSDDDWLSNFTRAQESVELARKAIAAFDEAKLQETFKSPQNSFEEQIMNQRMSPTRRRIYEAFTAASSEKKNLTRGEKDRGARNAEIDLGGSREEKVYNRERRDSMVHESSRNIEESPVIRNMYQQSEQRDDWEIQNKTGNPASNYIKIVRSNDISQNSPEQRNQTGEEGIQQIPIQTSSFKNQDGNLNKRNITSQHDENINSSMIPGNPAGLENIEIDEMVLKGDSQEENKCFGQFISDLKVISEDNARNGENDKILKQKAERELNNYFEEISNRDVSLSGIDASDGSGESVEADDEKDLQQHSISLYNVNDKSCKVALNKSMNGSQDAIEEKSLNSELPSFDSKGNLNQNQSAEENNKLQSNDLPDEVILSENDKRVERGRREMFGSPFNYYDSRYNIPNQLTLREIKKLIDDLAARKRELNYVMLNRKETPENNLKINSFEESATDHTEIYGNDSSTGPMHITIEDSVEGTESPVDDYKLESTNDFSNIQYNIDEDENRFEQKNRLHRQPQYNNKKPGKTDTDNIFVPEELQGDFHNQDSEVEASPISKPVLEISPEDMTNKGNKNVENIEPGKIGTNIRLSLAKEEEYNIGKSKNQFLEKTPESLDGDIQLTDVNNAPKIPITYSKVVTIVANDEKNEKLEKEKELGSVKTSTDKSVGSISIPKMNATQLRLERIESLRNRLLESRKKVIKSNLINATTKPPQILKKTPIEKSNANTAPDLDEKVPSGYLEEGAPTCKASRSAPYVEGIENWIDKIERDSEEIVAGFPHNQKVIGKQNVSSTVDKFNAEKESSQEDKSRKIDLIKSSRPITGTNKSINRMNGVQSGSIALKNRGTDVLTFDEMNSPFIIIPTSYAIMPIKPKRSRAAKNIRGYRSYNIDGNVDRRDHLNDFPIIRQEGGNHDIRSYNMGLEDNEFEAESDDIIPYSFPLMVTDPELTESLMENYGREKRSPEETADSNVGMLNRGLLNVKGLKRGFNGFRRNLLKTDNSKLQSLVSKISLEEIRSRVLARSKALRETLENARLKTPIKSRETRAISNIESRSRARSALGFADDLETNEIPKKRGEYLNVYEPVYDTSAEFEKKINSYKTYSRAIPISSRKSSIIHLDGDEVNAIKKQGSAKAYTDDNDYLNERMSRTDRAVVGLKHSVEELENTAKEILDKVRSSSDYSNVEERKKPFLQNILQSTLKLGRPKEPKRTGALAFLNPIIDIALKLMRSLGIIS